MIFIQNFHRSGGSTVSLLHIGRGFMRVSGKEKNVGGSRANGGTRTDAVRPPAN